MTVAQDNALLEYEAYSQKVINNILKNGEKGSAPEDVAKTIYKAATSNNGKLRYPIRQLKGNGFSA